MRATGAKTGARAGGGAAAAGAASSKNWSKASNGFVEGARGACGVMPAAGGGADVNGAGCAAATWEYGAGAPKSERSPIRASKSIALGSTGVMIRRTGIAWCAASTWSECEGPCHSAVGLVPWNRSSSGSVRRCRALSSRSNGSSARGPAETWRTGWLNPASCRGMGAPRGSSSGSMSSGSPPSCSAAAFNGPGLPAAATSSATKLYSPMRNSSPSVSTTRLSRAVGWRAPLMYTPLVLRSVRIHCPASMLITQCVFDRCRSGSGITQSLLWPRPMDSVPAVSERIPPPPPRLSLRGIAGVH